MLLVVIMIGGAAPLGALAKMDWLTIQASAESYSGYCGETVTWSLDTESGELTISGTGNMYDSCDGVTWHYYRSIIRNLTIEDGVTSIGDWAFYSFRQISTITIPDSVIGIGRYAFYDCSGLSSITIPDSVTNIGHRAFDGCSLESVQMGAGLTSIPSTLINYDSLKTFCIGTGITSIEKNTFYNCVHLEKVEIPTSVTNIGDSAFYECRSLSDISIPDSVTHIGRNSFGYCTGLASITIPDSVTSIDNFAFYNCPLEYVKMGSGLTTIPSTLINRATLKTIIIGESVTSIDNSAFWGCTELIGVVLPDEIVSIGDAAFTGCSKLSEVTIGNGVKRIGSNAFSECANLSSLTIGSSVTSIGNGAFSACTSLSNVMIPNSVTSIGQVAFSGCTNLSSMSLGQNVKTIESMAFNTCSSLKSIRIPKSVESINWSAFNGCTGLTNINVDDNNPAYSSDAYGVLYSKDMSTLIQYPVGNRRTSFTIPSSVTCIANYAFRNCTYLTDIDIDNTMRLIKSAAFGGCSNLREVRYHGTEVQWSTMQIEINNDELVLAKRVYCPNEPVPSDGTPVTIIYKQSKTLTANCPVVWASSDPCIAEVDPNTGSVQTRKTGTCKIIGTDIETGEIAVIYNVTVKYAWWQWLIRIFLLGFIWY